MHAAIGSRALREAILGSNYDGISAVSQSKWERGRRTSQIQTWEEFANAKTISRREPGAGLLDMIRVEVREVEPVYDCDATLRQDNGRMEASVAVSAVKKHDATV